MTGRWRTCAKCRTRRRIVDPSGICIDCRQGINTLTGGAWHNVRGIQRWIANPIELLPVPVTVKRGPKPIPDFFVWDWPDLIEAKRLHDRGDRTPWAIEGKRVYKRKTKRRQRAGKNEKEAVA